MRLGAVPEGLIESVLSRLGLLPQPLLDTQVAYTLARTVMSGVQLDVFGVIASEALTAEEVADRCNTHPAATKKLLNALVGAGYLRQHAARYRLTAVSRKWLVGGSPHSIRDKLLLQYREWDFVAHYEEFVRTGKPLDIHRSLSAEDWGLYQRGMRALAGVSAAEVARRTPVPPGAHDLLDVGGSHGYYSVSLCRRHPNLRAVILDLPEAVAHAEAILAREGLGDRVVHRAGDVLVEDLGEQAWDVVFVSQLLHHFDGPTNLDLTRRVARSLRPGGALVVQETVRPRFPQRAGQIGALLDLYFAATSEAGTWAVEEIAGWQREAGLVCRKPLWLRSLPGSAQQTAMKPR
jgi:SAM-dependent methyltransferase